MVISVLLISIVIGLYHIVCQSVLTSNLLLSYYIIGQTLFCNTGHTHMDVNQLFSYISRQVNSVNALALVELLKQIDLSYSPYINASIFSSMFDVKQLTEKFVKVNLTGYVDHHQFKLIGKNVLPLCYAVNYGCNDQRYFPRHAYIIISASFDHVVQLRSGDLICFESSAILVV